MYYFLPVRLVKMNDSVFSLPSSKLCIVMHTNLSNKVAILRKCINLLGR